MEIPERLRCIKPPPKDVEELEAMMEAFDCLVENARVDEDITRLEGFLKDLPERVKKEKKALIALEALSEVGSAEESIMKTRAELTQKFHEDRHLAWLLPGAGRGRPTDFRRKCCFSDCDEFLVEFGKTRHVAPLARVVWKMATNEDYSLESWRQMGKNVPRSTQENSGKHEEISLAPK